MKSSACGDVVPGCEATWVCLTEDDIVSRVALNAVANHGLVEVPAGLVSDVRANILTVA